MKIKELIQELSTLDPELLVVMSIDEEGNGFKTLREIATGDVFDEEEKEIHIKQLTPQLIKWGYSEEDVGEGTDCIVLWPN